MFNLLFGTSGVMNLITANNNSIYDRFNINISEPPGLNNVSLEKIDFRHVVLRVPVAQNYETYYSRTDLKPFGTLNLQPRTLL
jgi:hypothetical protein